MPSITARLLVYLAAGVLVGYGGSLLAQAGWRRGLALAAGVILLAQATGALGAVLGAAPGRVVGRVTARAARILPRHPLARAAALGLFNGLMPCGLLYGALAAAAGLGDPATAIAFVAAFGLGSLPAFAGLSCSVHTLGPRLPRRLRQAGPVALALVGLLLIARAWAPDAGARFALHLH